MAGSDTSGLDAIDVDAIDVKVNLAGADLPRARTVFRLVGAPSRRSVLHFCERPAFGRVLPLLDAGIVLRLREADDGVGDAVVLLRPCWPGRLTPAWSRRTAQGPADGPLLRVAGDWTPHTRVVAASATSPLPAPALHAALHEPDRIPEAFSPGQRALLLESAPRLPWPALRPFGPVEVRRWDREIDEGPLAATLWTVRWAPADPLDLLELRVTTEPPDGALVLPALAALVRDHGLDPEAVRTTKTRTVLAALTGAAGR